MYNVLLTIFGFALIFAATTLGAALVFLLIHEGAAHRIAKFDHRLRRGDGAEVLLKKRVKLRGGTILRDEQMSARSGYADVKQIEIVRRECARDIRVRRALIRVDDR